MGKIRSSSLPSRSVVSGTTLVLAILTSDEYGIDPFYVLLSTSLAFLLLSFARIHLGACYPSDCLLALPFVLIIPLFSYFLKLVSEDMSSCG